MLVRHGHDEFTYLKLKGRDKLFEKISRRNDLKN